VTDADDRPAIELADPKELLLGYLDFYRSVIARKLDGLTEPQLRGSRLPSGWAPLELLNHLVHMEARWVRWGFAAEQLPEPWGDEDQSGRWRAGPEESGAHLLAAMDAGGAAGPARPPAGRPAGAPGGRRDPGGAHGQPPGDGEGRHALPRRPGRRGRRQDRGAGRLRGPSRRRLTGAMAASGRA